MQPNKSGCRRKDGNFIEWFLFPRLTDEQTETFIERENLFPYYYGDGCFGRRAVVAHTKTRTLITRKGGWDV